MSARTDDDHFTELTGHIEALKVSRARERKCRVEYQKANDALNAAVANNDRVVEEYRKWFEALDEADEPGIEEEAS